MKDKTLLQCTSHLLERLEDKGIWRILEDSLRRDEDSLPSLVEQPTMTAPSKEFGNKGADRRLAMEDVKAKNRVLLIGLLFKDLLFIKLEKRFCKQNCHFTPLSPFCLLSLKSFINQRLTCLDCFHLRAPLNHKGE